MPSATIAQQFDQIPIIGFLQKGQAVFSIIILNAYPAKDEKSGSVANKGHSI
jgi:hypothetical protein